MIEKVNPSHPDKVADRIAGALVDLAYKQQENPRIAVEVLIGHKECHIIVETSVNLDESDVVWTVDRITNTPAGTIKVDYKEVVQDPHLAANQTNGIKCGDNGIFKGVPVSDEETTLSQIVRELYLEYPTDGKYIFDEEINKFIACQSCASSEHLEERIVDKLEVRDIKDAEVIVNPLGEWTGGTDVDTGATNRKLGSDMGRAVTGGGLHGKDLSKADVAVNIACHLMAQETGLGIEALCAIGDSAVEFRREDGEKARIPYDDVVQMAAEFIAELGGFESLAEWGLF